MNPSKEYNRSPKSQKDWSDKELKLIKFAFDNDIPASVVAKALGRSVNAVKVKSSRQDYPLK